MKYFSFIFFGFLSFNLYAANLDSYKTSCELIGFKPATPDFGDCVLELRKKDKKSQQSVTKSNYKSPSATPKAEVVAKGDGSQEDEICQQYGFKVGKSEYKQCRLDLKLARDQADAQKRIHDAQMAQYYQQKRLYDMQVAEMERREKSQNFKNLLSFGLGLASGKTAAQAAPALIGQPMMPNTPRQVIQPVYIQPLNNRSYQCRYDAWRKLYNCN